MGMGSMTAVGLLNNLVSLGVLVCWIIILVKMFQNGHTVAGILSIVICCVGWIIALVVGWQNVDRWRIRPLMYTYTGLLIANFILTGMMVPNIMEAVRQAQQQAIQQQQRGGMPAPAPAPGP